MPKIPVNGIPFYYEVRGEGFPIVMVMGLSANAAWWPPGLIQALAGQYKLLLFDNRGAGRTKGPAQEYRIPMFAEDTIGLMDALNIERAHIFGVSMGGMIAQEMALLHPERVEKMVLGCTHCGPAHSIAASPRVIGVLMKRDYKTVDEFITQVISILFPEETISRSPILVEELKKRYLIAPIRPDAYARQLQAILHFDSFDRLPRIKAPTLVMTGDRDILVLPQNSVILAQAIPNARLLFLEGCGHSFINQVPDRVFPILKDFLG